MIEEIIKIWSEEKKKLFWRGFSFRLSKIVDDTSSGIDNKHGYEKLVAAYSNSSVCIWKYIFQPVFICLKSAIETPEQYMNFVIIIIFINIVVVVVVVVSYFLKKN